VKFEHCCQRSFVQVDSFLTSLSRKLKLGQIGLHLLAIHTNTSTLWSTVSPGSAVQLLPEVSLMCSWSNTAAYGAWWCGMPCCWHISGCDHPSSSLTTLISGMCRPSSGTSPVSAAPGHVPGLATRWQHVAASFTCLEAQVAWRVSYY